jgi:two-component system sensor histidine kinase UhpB
VLIPTVIVLAGLLGTLGFVLGGARGRVQAETSSGMHLGSFVIQDRLRAIMLDPTRFAESLPTIRHVRFALGRIPGQEEAAADSAPRWFVRWLSPRPVITSFPITIGGTPTAIVMRSWPDDEIGEIWGEVLLLGALLLAVGIASIALIVATVNWGLRPLRQLAGGFNALEQGAEPCLPATSVTELQRIFAQFNHLSAALARARADNRLLIDRMMSVQEAERRQLGRELHDEIGPALFGIRADAACIRRWAADAATHAAAIAERAGAIAGLADGLQQATYRMLDRMRPLLLEQLGLIDALRALIADWTARQPGIRFIAEIPPALPVSVEAGDARDLVLYRAAQEGLTNAIRHARPRTVWLSLIPAGTTLRLRVEDDGAGLAPGYRSGYGLLGMAERLRAEGGQMSIAPRAGGGTVLAVSLRWSQVGVLAEDAR